MNNKKSKKKTTKNNDLKENDKTKKYKIKGKTKKENNKEEKTKKGKKKHQKLKKAVLIIFCICLLLVLIGAGIVAGIFFSDKFKLTEEDLIIENINGVIKDTNGEVIGTLSGDENRKIVKLDEIPAYLPKAFVAIEDKRFYEHNGVDIKRTTYATIMYALHRGDSTSGGGSTITQQLVKNLMNDKDDSGAAGIERKIREMARAYNVEKIISKDQILELYLNKIFMGSTVYGVGMAAEYYFNKPVDQLDLAECAFLAGINHTPNSYDPFDKDEDNSEIIRKRTKEVLYQMKDQGYITDEEEYNKAVEKVEKGIQFSQGNIASKANYSYHTTEAIKQAIKDIMDEKDVSEDTAEFMIYNKGYTIYTTEDSAIQTRLEEEFLKDKYIKSGKTKKSDGTLLNDHTQAAMVIIDHTTGKVVATVGGLGADSNSIGTNRATQTKKQPGSSIKPIGVIAPALEKGIITSGTVYDDSATSFGSFAPHNSGGYGGLMTIRTALAKSSNIVHVKVLRELGISNSFEMLEKFGISTLVSASQDSAHNDESLASLALGGLTNGIYPLEMAAAYAAIANNGEYITPIFYTKVEDSSGNIIVEAKQEKTRVMSETNAYILQNLLTSPAKSGTAAVCSMSNMDVGAKTGSTNDYIDRWLCGFTPYYTAATWFGFDYSEKPVFSTNNAANIWAAVMKDVHKNLPTKRFVKPSNVSYVKICQDSGCVATDSCTNTISDVFARGTIPSTCEGHTKLKICKDTGKIANEYCTNVEEKTYLVKPTKENTTLWNTNAGDKYNIPTETCDKHKAPEQVEVPNVVGKTSAQAKKELEAKGLKVEIKYSEDKNKKDGIVLKQSIEEKKKVDKGTTITITVNKKSTTGNNVNENTTTNEITNSDTNTISNTTT